MRTGSPEREAWHEAGHAVTAHVLGGEIREVTLEAEDDAFEGRVTVAWPGCGAREAASRSGRAALAGPLAELRRYGDEAEPDTAAVRAAWRGDWDEVERCAAECQADPERRTALIESWASEVAAMLADPAVETLVGRVADALDAHGTLDATLFEDCL